MFTHIGTPVPLTDLQSVTTATGRHYTTPAGRQYPSITTVLGSKEKPWLDSWRNMLGKSKADKEQARCAERGTAVHELVEHYLNNQEEFTRGYNPDYVKLFNQLKFKLNKIDNIRAQEVALYSDDLKVAGRVDCVAEYDGVVSIIDFKTSNNNKDKDMIEDYFKQCTAYAIMWFELTGEAIEDIVILMTVERGMMPLVFHEKIENWVAPLLKDIQEYHNTH